MSTQSVDHFFSALLEKDDGSSGTYVVVPLDVKQVFGARGRVPVCGTINGVAFRGSIHPYGGVHYLGINRSLRESAGVQAGDRVDIVMRRDDAPREVAPPDDLAAALAANEPARDAWSGLSYSRQRDYVLALEAAKKLETRSRRIEKMILELIAIRSKETQE